MYDSRFAGFLCMIGGMFIAGMKRIASFFVKAFFAPVKKLFIKIYGTLKSVVIYMFRKVRAGLKDTARLVSQTHSVMKRRRAGEKISASECIDALKKKHGALLRYVGNCVVVAVVIIAMLAGIPVMKIFTAALRVEVNGETVGYVTDESVYNAAKARADGRMALASGKAADGKYSIAVIPSSELCGESVVYAALVKNSEMGAVSGCGVFIDGNFVCVTESQDTAKGAFDRLLELKKEQNGEFTYSFNEDVVFEYGLYPDDDDIFMTGDELYDYITTPVNEQEKYICAEGDTYETAAQKAGIGLEKLMALNPAADEKTEPQPGQALTVSDPEYPVSVKSQRVNVYTVSVPFETVNINSTALYNGNTLVLKEGEQGIDQVTELISYDEDGEETEKTEVSRFTVKNAVARRIAIGTKIPSILRYTKSFGGVFLWPAPQNCFRLSSGYGYRNGKLHAGIDIISSDGGSCRGRPIVAAAAGYVVTAQYHYSWGNYVKIDHGNGIMTLYAHALDNSFKVSPGDYVVAGQQLSSIGTTGNSTGYHLHFEVWINGTRVDPLPYVYSETVQVVE